MSVVGVKGNSAVYTGTFGKRDISRNLDVNDSTMFRVASVSKTLVAAGIMKLHAVGALNVYNDVNRYLNFPIRNPNFASDSITVRMLLSHTSSLQDGGGYDNFLSTTSSLNPPPDLFELLTKGGSYYTDDMFRAEKPGSYFNYSNIEFGVLGTIIENVTNTRFDIWIRQNMLLPLHIKGSFNVQDISDINNVAVLYRHQSNEWVPQADNFRGEKPPPRDLIKYIIGNNGLIFSPAGGLRISAKDLSSFMLMYMNDGSYNGNQILDESACHLLNEMQWNYIDPSNGNNYEGLFRRWAMGLQVTTNAENGDVVFPDARPMWGHCGDAYGLISDMWGNPLTKSGVIFINTPLIFKQQFYPIPIVL
jgi:CubicO group peptidase (beta-lactamase class C family)